MSREYIGAIVIVVWLAYSLYVISLIVRSGKYERGQLLAQSAVAVVFPFVGAMVIHGVHRAANGPVEKTDRNFIRDQSANETDLSEIFKRD